MRHLKSNDGIIYLYLGMRHASHLVVSLWSLRKWYKGPVVIMSDRSDAGWKFLEEYILQDHRLGPIELIDFNYVPSRKSGKSGGHYLAKCNMGDLSPFERTVFLDADTLVNDDFSRLFPRPEFVSLTRFCDWTTQTKRIGNRIANWEQFAPTECALQLAVEYPAINTGVIGFTKQSKRFMNAWREMTSRNVSFICDEIACQLMFLYHPHVVYNDSWNCSPKLSAACREPTKHHVKIWHGHGFKFLKSETGWNIWLPWYFDVLEENVAGIADWADAKHLVGHPIKKQPPKYLSMYSEKYGWRAPRIPEPVKHIVEPWLKNTATCS